jgi:uncharacterized membrane protein YdjX (TVP38/TMEM64 family)
MQIKAFVSFLAVALLFLASAYLTQVYKNDLVLLIGEGSLVGIAAYTCIAILTTVIAPLSSVPLLPVAANIWGPVVAAIASIIGWLLGALIAFGIGRRYGRGLVEKIVSKERLMSIEKRVPKENLFWSIVFLRIAVPVDVLSYVLGLFSNISWRTYTLATLIGITPFAFVLAYTGTLPLRYQLIAVATSLVVILLIWNKHK